MTPGPAAPQQAPGVRTIVLDPGHGGTETGAIGPSGIQEKELTLTLARELEARLESQLGVRVILTRNEDANLPHDARTAIANQNRADLFISLHLNSSLGSGAHGAETYFLGAEASDEAAARMAAAENAGDPALHSPSTADRRNPCHSAPARPWQRHRFPFLRSRIHAVGPYHGR